MARDYVLFTASAWPDVDFHISSQRVSVSVAEPVTARARRRLEIISKLKRNWDSYGANPTSREALKRTDALLRRLEEHPHIGTLSSEAAPFAVAPTPAGGIQLEWRLRGAVLELEIDANGRAGLLWDRPTEAERFNEEEGVSDVGILRALENFLGW
jgi:hypothetical protein